jgi:hypothetical protein
LDRFAWYNSGYDEDYQSVIDATDVPGSHLVIISVQRSSNLVVYDPDIGKQVDAIALAGRPETLHIRVSGEIGKTAIRGRRASQFASVRARLDDR